ncbi:hypothetical protein [Periweissella ghanensis]|uniref:Uncharacterized protein n=1 Tax=Periweissella ghanensis TaxID=467997 RepID=A0ABM8Z9L5_9LACO|nr:hypothetical protein [Periweissella ghanensis]MCM0601228.1 hypothetical protein [Periweissella ghanensis]CAH0418028.1 hypothetical protein WGH24286_00444 [Periweissella ghanensis]
MGKQDEMGRKMQQNFITPKLMEQNEVVVGVGAQKKTTILNLLTNGLVDAATQIEAGDLTNRFYATKNNVKVLLQGFNADGALLFVDALNNVGVNTFKIDSNGQYNYQRLQQYK